MLAKRRAQVPPGHEFHHQEGSAIGQRAVVEDRHNRGMLQLRDDLRLAPEARARVWIAEQVRFDHLERDVAIEPHVARAEDRAHPTSSQRTVYAVPAVHKPRQPATSRIAVRSSGHAVTLASSHRPHCGHSDNACIVVPRRVRCVPLSSSGAADDCRWRQSRHVECERHLRGDRSEQLAIFRRVGLLASLSAHLR